MPPPRKMPRNMPPPPPPPSILPREFSSSLPSMAQPQQVLTISSLSEAEQVTEDLPVDEVGLLVDAEMPLKYAEEIKVDTKTGIRGIRVMNPELMDCKARARSRLDRAFYAMVRDWMGECRREINRVDLLIYTVKNKLAIPDARLPHRGPPENQRNQGIYQYLHTSRFGEYPTHDESTVLYQAPYDSAEERARAIQRDRDSQRAWWKLNLKFLEAKKKVLEEKVWELESRVYSIWDEALKSRSLLGAGYADYRFEAITDK